MSKRKLSQTRLSSDDDGKSINRNEPPMLNAEIALFLVNGFISPTPPANTIAVTSCAETFAMAFICASLLSDRLQICSVLIIFVLDLLNLDLLGDDASTRFDVITSIVSAVEFVCTRKGASTYEFRNISRLCSSTSSSSSTELASVLLRFDRVCFHLVPSLRVVMMRVVHVGCRPAAASASSWRRRRRRL